MALWAIDENMGTNLQAFYKHFYIGCLKTQKQQLYFVKIIFFFFVIRAGRKPVRAGRSALRNRPSCNTAVLTLTFDLPVLPVAIFLRFYNYDTGIFVRKYT